MSDLEYKKDSLYKELKKNIQAGTYVPGYHFPAEVELAKQLNLAKVTVRSAFAMLEADGLIKRIRGKGTFVTSEKNKTGDIIVITGNLNEFASPYPYVLEGIKKAAVNKGINIRICERYYIESFQEEEFAESVRENNIAGVLILGAYITGEEKVIKIIQSSGLPAVIPHAIGNSYFTTGFACTQIDMRTAWEDAVMHLSENGHRRIATLALETNPDIRGFSTEEHFSLLKKYNAETNKDLFRSIPYDREIIIKTVNAWMNLQTPPTAILCFSDFFAIHVYEALKKLKLKIPEHVAVMGCCGYPGASLMTPPLSTVDFAYQKQGEAALELLLKSGSWFPAESNVARPRMITKHTLLQRESTAIKIMERMLV